MAYDRINWENTPSTNTPLNADNLNNMDAALANLDNLITAANELITQLQGYIDLLNARIDTVVTRPEGATGLINITDGNATGSVLTIGAIDSVEYPLGDYSFAEGQNTKATGIASHAEGCVTSASGLNSHAEGSYNVASGDYSHAEGYHVSSTDDYAHSEGYYTTSSGAVSHSEGSMNIASGNSSHAEGAVNVASGYTSHVEGYGNEATHRSQHVFGEYAAYDPSTSDSTNRGTYVEIVGNGMEDSRSNARTLDWQGNEAIAGSLTVGKGSASEATLTPIMVDSLRFFHVEGTTLAINAHPTITIEEDVVDDGEIWTSGP